MSMPNILLPHDVVVEILSRLPVKSLLRFRCVSKPWKSLFSDPSFINMHLNHSRNNYEHVMIHSDSSYIKMHLNQCFNNHQQSSLAAAANDDDDEVVEIIHDYPLKRTSYGFKIFGSCNGLLLITPFDEKIYCIWNPSTKEFKKLPHTPIEFPKKMFTPSVFGFGYDKTIEDYKVVRIVKFNDRSSEVQVYTLGSDSWRRIDQDIPETLALIDYRTLAGKLVNGVLHWLVVSNLITPTSYGVYDDEVPYIILSFDIADEKFGQIQQPDFTDTEFYMNAEVLGGCLCLICNFDHVRSEIWVMKEYGVKESWTKLFTIPCSGSVRPIKLTKNGEVLFLKDNTSLVMYDRKHGSAKTHQIHGLKPWFQKDIYVEGLISLNSGTFVGARTCRARGKELGKRTTRRTETDETRELNLITLHRIEVQKC